MEAIKACRSFLSAHTLQDVCKPMEILVLEHSHTIGEALEVRAIANNLLCNIARHLLGFVPPQTSQSATQSLVIRPTIQDDAWDLRCDINHLNSYFDTTFSKFRQWPRKGCCQRPWLFREAWKMMGASCPRMRGGRL